MHITSIASLALAASISASIAAESTVAFARSNLVAWCIVPFDGKKRGPAERAEMLVRLGLKRCAYDWRQNHVAEFEDEILQYQKHGIEYFAFWGSHPKAFELFRKYELHPQIWQTLGSPNAPTQEARVAAAAKGMLGMVEETRKLGSKLGLYNHGGWGGEPTNLVAVCQYLRKHHNATHVGIVYNFHHAHEHIADFAESFALMKPYLLCLNLNGMNAGAKPKILQLGQGDFDLRMLKVVKESGYSGPIGIIGHTQDDVEERLRDNLDGLDWLLPQLDEKPAGPKPKPRTARAVPLPATPKPAVQSAQGLPSLSPAFGKALARGHVIAGRPEYRQRPITIECRAKLDSKNSFNILVASDPKASAEHWEIYSYRGSGVFSLYQPGRGGEFKTTVDICDGQWHALAAVIDLDRVRLYVDGRLALDQPAPRVQGSPRPGGLAFGRLVEGGIGCDGVVDDVRISAGARKIDDVHDGPLQKDSTTIGLWDFDDLAALRGGRLETAQSPLQSAADFDAWAVEDAKARKKLPPFRFTPAAKPGELTPANSLPQTEALSRWTRSHGGDECLRYSSLTRINRSNVSRLKVAWTYQSKDGRGNIQCNPIVVNGVLYAPTVGNHLVALNAATGKGIWRFKPDDRPAFRGLTYWPGGYGAKPRLFFPTEKRSLYALDPTTGKPDPTFGEGGKVYLPEGARVAPVVFESTLVISGYLKDVHAFDVVTGKPRWTFHTVPRQGEFGFDTWAQTSDNAANCWGGMALDAQRGIVFITTGSPKPNFLGMQHCGDNLFANCVVAIEARTGKRLWHFQEIPHDIWDLDIPAPPILTTIARDGKRVDVVASVSKTANTILLDRVTGKPVFPFRWRRAPTSEVPGEVTAPYQADVELPQPFARQVYSLRDTPDWSEEVKEWAAGALKSARFGRFLPISDRKVTVFYNVHGGAEWTGACSDPNTGRLYVSANQVPWLMSLINWNEPKRDPNAPKKRGQILFETTCAQCHGTNRLGIGVAPPLLALSQRLKDEEVIALLKTGRGQMPVAPEMGKADLKALLDFIYVRDLPESKTPPNQPTRPNYTQNKWSRFLDPQGYPASKPPWGTLNCIDLNTGKLVWQVPLGEYEELTRQGVPITGTENFGGAIVTAGGLVFCAGTRDEKIRAFDADTGKELWSHKLPFGGYAPPTTYEVNGRQYVVISATGGGKLGGPTGDAWVAFALPENQ